MKGQDLRECKWHFNCQGAELPRSAKVSVQARMDESGLPHHHCGARSCRHRVMQSSALAIQGITKGLIPHLQVLGINKVICTKFEQNPSLH